jgi:hypothetical protein
MPSALERYKSKSQKIVHQFLRREITFPQCVTALADALVMAKMKIEPAELIVLSDAMLANNARLMTEMEKRESRRISNNNRKNRN